MKRNPTCKPTKSPEVFSYCDDLLSVVEEVRPNIKGIVEIQQMQSQTLVRNYVVAKQGDYRYKGLAFNYCPYCGEAIRLKPSELKPTNS